MMNQLLASVNLLTPLSNHLDLLNLIKWMLQVVSEGNCHFYFYSQFSIKIGQFLFHYHIIIMAFFVFFILFFSIIFWGFLMLILSLNFDFSSSFPFKLWLNQLLIIILFLSQYYLIQLFVNSVSSLFYLLFFLINIIYNIYCPTILSFLILTIIIFFFFNLRTELINIINYKLQQNKYQKQQ